MIWVGWSFPRRLSKIDILKLRHSRLPPVYVVPLCKLEKGASSPWPVHPRPGSLPDGQSSHNFSLQGLWKPHTDPNFHSSLQQPKDPTSLGTETNIQLWVLLHWKSFLYIFTNLVCTSTDCFQNIFFFFTDKIIRKRKPVCPEKDTNQQCWEYNEKPSFWCGRISWKGMYSVSGTAFRERT